jgi:hypothetical protein
MPEITLIERHKQAAKILPAVSRIINGQPYSADSAGIYEHINPATSQAQYIRMVASRHC